MKLKKQQKSNLKTTDIPLWRFFLEIVVVFLVVFGIGRLLTTYVIAERQVVGASMAPTFADGDRAMALRHGTIKRGSIVMLKAPDEPGFFYIKRVIGLPGDNVVAKNDTIYVNGNKLKEPYLNAYKQKLPAGTLFTQNFTYQGLFNKGDHIPKNQYFVMGDNRNISKDSRMLGTIKKSAIIGVVKFRYWPLNQLTIF
nr:signal peptidase I [Agrilactobacillus composti]